MVQELKKTRKVAADVPAVALWECVRRDGERHLKG